MEITINGKQTQIDVEADTPLLWALRDGAGMTGTKYGCGVAQCGACTVWVDGQPLRSCIVPVSAVIGKEITTIEAIERDPVGQAR
jgi:isoquinoline 1-oxidoreductase alpha subunit